MYNAEIISKHLETVYIGKKITYFDNIGSTNDYAKRWAREGAREGAIVIADQQNAGRGRLGRQWHSPSGTGVWMSMVVRPDVSISQIPRLTIVAGLSMCMAIREETGLDAKIKWPNDIVIEGKKVCGILAEMGMQGKVITHVVIGIGVNVNTEVFDEALPYASSLKCMGNQKYDRAHLVATFAKYFETYYDRFKCQQSIKHLLGLYKQYCITLGSQVMMSSGSLQKSVFVKDITEDGALITLDEEGEEETVFSGEVSVRGLYGYI